jgi:hypothetical protein
MINRPIIIVVIFQASIHTSQYITYICRFQMSIAHHIFQNIPQTLDHIQVVNKYVVNGVAETGVDETRRIQHLLNDPITHNIEHLFWQLLHPVQFPEIIQLFHIQNVAHIEPGQYFVGLIHSILCQNTPATTRYFLDKLVFGGRFPRFCIFTQFWLLDEHFHIGRLRRPSHRNHLTRIENIVGNESQVFCHQNKSQLNRRQLVTIFLDITVKDFEEFAVYDVKILTDDDADFVVFDGYCVHNLLDYIVPDLLGITPEKPHIYFVMDIANSELVSVFLGLDIHFLVIFEGRWTVSLYGVEHLRIFAGTGWAVKNEIGDVTDGLGELGKYRSQLWVNIIVLNRAQIFLVFGFIVLHWII